MLIVESVARGIRTGIVSYNLSDEIPSWEIADKLFHRYIKPFKPPEKPNAIRISVSDSTTESEIGQLTESLSKELGELPRFSVY